MKTNLSIFNQLRPITIGFDNIFDHFERVLDGDVMNIPTVNYPPYNIVRTGENTYDIELALAGFSKDDINVEYENNVLTVQSIKREETEKEINDAILHRGISKRMFTKSFTVADDVEVNGAELKDGLLRVSLERIIPESKKPRTIEIK
jgi:molecular chaperone IbpA|tara:strand:+ start:4962 stop:5405 length:444 start_codon:yes stop_codon:yes gene_type:complete